MTTKSWVGTIQWWRFGLLVALAVFVRPVSAQGLCGDVCNPYPPDVTYCGTDCTDCDAPTPDGYCAPPYAHPSTCQAQWGDYCPQWVRIRHEITGLTCDTIIPGFWYSVSQIVEDTWHESGGRFGDRSLCSTNHVADYVGGGITLTDCCRAYGCWGRQSC